MPSSEEDVTNSENEVNVKEEEDGDQDEEQVEEEEDFEEEPTDQKKKKPGIVYLSTIPPGMGVRQIREALGEFGELGRVFLQRKEGDGKTKGKPVQTFTEGWVEFQSKRVAKRVAEMLNNTKVGGKRRSKAYETLWNIKYLPRFKWAHLNERLAYEKAMHQQRLRTEIAQAKQETNFFIQSLEKNQRLKKRKAEDTDETVPVRGVAQKPTDNEIVQKKKKSKGDDRTGFLKSLFGNKTDS